MMMIDTLVSNVNVGFEGIIIILALLCGLVFYAKDFTLGLVMHFFVYACIFAWFYHAGYAWVAPLVIMFIFLVLMAFSLYATSQKTIAGGVS